ncbi:MAG: DUF4167 domain-containing protein [Sphingomonas sp.]|nr:DUF4167 domain-containing protein [Sphingomonas sp.]
MINNRQGGRRRGRGGQRAQGGNPGRGQDNGNRIDNRARGNAAQLLEKYKTLARDAQMQGDRVNTEYYLQFADHYFRVLAETRSRFEENQPRRNHNDQFDGDDGDDFDPADVGGDDAGELISDRGNDRSNDRDGNGYRGDRSESRNDGRSDARGNGRSDNGNNRGNVRGSDRGNDRANNQANDRGNDRGNSRGNDGDADRADTDGNRMIAADESNDSETAGQRASAPRASEGRSRRPRLARNGKDTETANGEDGESIALGIDRLPPAISAAEPEPETVEEKPRRRRRAATDEATPVG